MTDLELKADAFMTTFLHCYNALDQNVQIVLGDKPTLIHREMTARSMNIGQAKHLFD